MSAVEGDMEGISLADSMALAESPQIYGMVDSSTMGQHCEVADAVESPNHSRLNAVTKLYGSKSFGLRDSVTLIVKFFGIGGMVSILTVAAVGRPVWLVQSEYARTHVMSGLFSMGLFMVALEDIIGVSKSAIMLLLAATLWTILAVEYDPPSSEDGAYRYHHELNRGLQDVGSVVLFLLPAMAVVESIDHFKGFEPVTVAIRKLMSGQSERLTPIVCVMTFFLSSIIDNLTASIVAIKIIRHVAGGNDERRQYLGGLAVIAANAGGAWSPIGDVTTTMLWISGKISAPATVVSLFFPSLVSGLFPLMGMCTSRCSKPPEKGVDAETRRTDSELIYMDEDPEARPHDLEEEPLDHVKQGHGHVEDSSSRKTLSLVIGVSAILLVPVLKMWIGLPPYLGMLLALGLMWLISDLLNFDNLPVDSKHGSSAPRGVVAALYKVDLTGLLFFTGVLLSVGALDSAGVLHSYAKMLVSGLGDDPVALCTVLGLSSAVVDNVPLVEASIDMFNDVGMNDRLWQLIALAAGTGGSILSVGSIAGVTLMSMEGVSFLWYCKRITPWALIGFLFGVATYQIQYTISRT